MFGVPQLNKLIRECKHDRLDVHDGASSLAKLLGSFCGSSAPGSLVSTGPYMMLRFVSDATVNHEGFIATYRIGGPRL